MIISSATGIQQADVLRFAWSGLKRFHHAPSLAETLIQAHSIPEQHRQNAIKQATQIRHCLIQAREYRDAAAVTSLATRPLLLYYSCMCLALAQILFKGSGSDSLDKARGEHAHHGLLFSASDIPKNSYSLAASAAALRAEPMINKGNRRGTFELWHRTARETPLAGPLHIEQMAGGSSTRNVQIFFNGTDERMGYLPSDGISFLDCIKATPGMMFWLHQTDAQSNIARGSISAIRKLNDTIEMSIVIHPNRQQLLEDLKSRFIFKAEDHDRIDVQEYTSGFGLRFSHDRSNPIFINIPAASTWSNEELRFLPTNSVLNEFGYLYIGLYMLGNYARYFPDKWMSDVEMGSLLSLSAEEFMTVADWRMALLTLSELSQTYYVLQS